MIYLQLLHLPLILINPHAFIGIPFCGSIVDVTLHLTDSPAFILTLAEHWAVPVYIIFTIYVDLSTFAYASVCLLNYIHIVGIRMAPDLLDAPFRLIIPYFKNVLYYIPVCKCVVFYETVVYFHSRFVYSSYDLCYLRNSRCRDDTASAIPSAAVVINFATVWLPLAKSSHGIQSTEATVTEKKLSSDRDMLLTLHVTYDDGHGVLAWPSACGQSEVVCLSSNLGPRSAMGNLKLVSVKWEFDRYDNCCGTRESHGDNAKKIHRHRRLLIVALDRVRRNTDGTHHC